MPGATVSDQLSEIAKDARVTLLAVDGDVTTDVENQLLARTIHEMPNSHLSPASTGNSVRSEIQSVFRSLTEFPVNTGSVAIIRHFMNTPG